MSKGFIGGSFAPPLTDATIENYRALIEATDPKTRVGDCLRILLNCCLRWWALPESTGDGGKDRTGRSTLIPLEPAIQSELFDHIPWMEELDAMNDILDTIQSGEANRNAAKLNAWRNLLASTLFESKYPGETLAEFNRIASRYVELVNSPLQLAPAAVTAIMGVEFPDIDIEVQKAKAVVFETELRQQLSPAFEAPLVVRPELESTELRNAAFHLLWHAKELCLDREPITLDKLG